MAEILLARIVGPKGFERPVAIKRMLDHLTDEKRFVEMMSAEARIAAQIHHPNVIQIYELLEHHGIPHIVMEYLEGESLAGLLRRTVAHRQALHPALVAHILAEAAAGLHAAHELRDSQGTLLNVVHRDVSPQNVFVTYDGAIKVLDFGIAKATHIASRTQTGELKGKFHYMSPEQIEAKELDRRSDVFSLGILLHECLTARRLFKKDNAMLTMRAILQEPIPSARAVRETVPESLDEITKKALKRDRDVRFQSAEELRDALLLASRELAPRMLPQKQLREIMGSLFADRRHQKAEMLQALQRNARVTIPDAEVDLEVDLPQHSESRIAYSESGILRESEFVAADEGPSPLVKVVVALLLVLLFAFAAWMSIDDDPNSDVVESVPAVTPVGEASTTETPSAATSVSIDVQTTPAGATVSFGGEVRGQTPVRLELPSSDEAVTIQVSLPGYITHTEDVIPDVNQRLTIGLDEVSAPPSEMIVRPRTPRPRRPRTRMADEPRESNPPTMATSMEGSGFSRFD